MSKTKRKRAPGARDAPAAKRSMLIQTDAGITTVSEWLRQVGHGYTPLDRCPEIRMCAHAYADMISDMTVHLMRHTDGGDIRVINELSRRVDIEPHPHMQRKQLIYWIVHTLMLEGDGNAVLIPVYDGEYLAGLYPVPPSAVSITDRPETGGYVINIGGEPHDPAELIHIAINPDPARPWRGTGMRLYLRDAVQCLARASAVKGSLMEAPSPSIIVKVDGLTDEYADPKGQDRLSERFEAARHDGRPWYIPAEAFDVVQVKPMTMTDLAIRDNVELDRRTVAAMFGVPAFMVGVGDFSRDAYNNFIASRLLGVAQYIEQALTRKLLYSEDYYFKFNPRSLYNYQLSELITAGSEMVDRMAMRRNEWRDWVGLPPDDDMTELLALENYIPANRLGDQTKLTGGGET